MLTVCLFSSQYTFHPQVLYCYGKPLCTIPRDTAYYGYQNRSESLQYRSVSGNQTLYIHLSPSFLPCLPPSPLSILPPPPSPPSPPSQSCFLLPFSRYVYCPRCFTEMPGDTITVGDDPMTATVVRKSAFKEMKNDSIDYEP